MNLPFHIEEKIYDIKKENSLLKITSYFPFLDQEKQQILSIIGDDVKFYSIFTDHVSEEEWVKSKEQIKKRFQDELIDIE